VAKKSKLCSGDWLVDWFFRKFVTILNHPDFEVIGVAHLKMRGTRKRKVEVYAYMDGLSLHYNTSRVFHSSRERLGVTLCHELFHVLLKQGIISDVKTIELYGIKPTTHRDVYTLERIWYRFNEAQQELLLSYFPKQHHATPR